MTREALLVSLAELVKRRAITEAEAARIVALFDADEFVPVDLPVVPPGNDDWLAAFALLLLLLGGKATRPLSTAQRNRAQTLLRNSYQAQTLQLAQGVTGGAISAQTWATGMQQALTNYTLQMAVAGAGTLPKGPTRVLVEVTLAEQWTPLQRFALQIQARQLGLGRYMMGPAAVTARSKLYGNMGWRAFYLAQTAAIVGQGWVEQYFTRDDGRVCPACGPRHLRYYLPGRGPIPGYAFCYGNCRCRRVPVYAPDIYRRLIGERDTARARRVKASQTKPLLPPAPPSVPGGPTPPASPRDNTNQPLGISVSTRLTLPLSSPDRAALREAMAAVDQVHGDGDLAIIPLRRVPGMRVEAEYHSANGKAIEIRMNPDAKDKQIALVHEVGHWLDEQRLHMTEGVSVNRAVAAANRRVMETIKASRQHELLNDMLAERASVQFTDPATNRVFNYRPPSDYLRYLLRDDELWSRAYAQYISVRSQSPGLLEEFLRFRGRPGASEQWGDEDFQSIASAVDESMRLLGWRK